MQPLCRGNCSPCCFVADASAAPDPQLERQGAGTWSALLQSRGGASGDPNCKTKAYAAYYNLLYRSPVMLSKGAPQMRDDHIAHKVRVGLLASLQGREDTCQLSGAVVS